MPSSVQVLGIGNAIVDVLSHVEEEFLDRLGAAKSSMVLIDQARAKQIYSMIGPATEMSGGSVANSIANIANLGGQDRLHRHRRGRSARRASSSTT